MSFKCAGCGYRFQIQPENILNQDSIAANIVLVKTDKLSVHENLQEVVDKIESGVYTDRDTIRIFGQPWQFLGEADELHACFQTDDASDTEHVPEPELTPEESGSIVEDISLDFEEASKELSEIDPFSEVEEAIVDVDEASQTAIVVEESEDGWVIDDEVDVDDEGLEEPAMAVTDDTPFPTMDESSPASDGQDLPEDIEQDISESVGQEDISFDVEWSEEEVVTEVTETVIDNFDGVETAESEFNEDINLEDIEANLLEELDFDSEETVVSDSAAVETQPVSKDVVNQEKSQTVIQQTSQKEHFSNDVKRQLLSSSEQEPEAVESEVLTAIPEVEGEEKDEEKGVTPKERPKQRLSFSNKVPEVPKSTKVDVNPMYIFAAIILFSIGVLGYILYQSEFKQTSEYNGLATNSDRLKQTTEDFTGLRENDGENSERVINGSVDESSDSNEESTLADVNFDEGLEQNSGNLFPQVLPDVPAESLDYSKDRTPTELTRMGFQALYQEKDPDLAIRYFNLALTKNGGYTEAEFGLGKAYEARGEEDLAVEHICKSSIEETQYRLNSVLQLGRDCL